jgi:anaerobic ribonucleoside-triphosphate reductase activating protein
MTLSKPRTRSHRGEGATLTIDVLTGRLLVENPDRLPEAFRAALEERLGQGVSIACAAPDRVLTMPAARSDVLAAGPYLRLAGYWHDSLIEGPGRRSVAKFQGCSLHCRGCITPDSWDPSDGTLVSIDRLADTLLDPTYERDGVTLLGGEPTAQPAGLLALVRALRLRGCPHILVYSGYPYESLQRIAERQPAFRAILEEIDVLIDGPFVAALADGAGPWTGSSNQRVIDVPATRHLGRAVVMAPPEVANAIPNQPDENGVCHWS